MKYFYPLLAIFLFVSVGCFNSRTVEIGEEGQKAINNANNQNDAIAETLKDDKPYHAAGIQNNTSTIREVLNFNAKSDAAKEFRLELKEQHEAEKKRLIEEWQNEKEALVSQIKVNEKYLDKAKEESERKGFWLTVVGIAGGIWATIKTFRGPLKLALNSFLPGAGKVVDWLSLAGNTYEKKDTLASAVRGADEGIKAAKDLESKLDKLLEGKLKAQVEELTDGKATSIVDYLKKIAQATQLDEGRLSDVENILKKLRDEKKTNEADKIKAV